MIRAAIVGATGYVAEELYRLLLQHPGARVVEAVSSGSRGKKLEDVYPSLRGFGTPELAEYDENRLIAHCDVVFLALPHGASGPLAKGLLAGGLKVIDLSADFRYKNRQTYEDTYRVSHCAPELLEHSVYGLCEIYGEKISKAALVANPGCYTTCSLLSLIPLLESGYIQAEDLLIDAASGISGAGAGLAADKQFARVDGNFKAYGVGVHRHTSEIEEQLGFHLPHGIPGSATPSNAGVQVQFTPHLLPVKRGILATLYARPKTPFGESAEGDIAGIYREYYGGKPFIQILAPGEQPELSHVVGSNQFHLGYVADRRTGRLVVTAALDNLIKGAAGQAIQNMNLLFGLDQTTGLRSPAWYL